MHRARPTGAEHPNWPLLFQALYREWLGFLLVLGYLIITPIALRATVFNRMYLQMGAIRYSLMVILLLFMALMPIKMVLRWLFNVKYFIYLPEFNSSF